MIRTPSSYGGARGGLRLQYEFGNGNQKHDRGLRFVVRDLTYIRNGRKRVFGSTGEPDGRGEGIWDGGLVVSL